MSGPAYATNLLVPTNGSAVQVEPIGYAGAAGFQDVRARNVIAGTGAAGTNVTNGFAYTASGAGAPVGVPAVLPTGSPPLYVDSTNAAIYAYYGAAWNKISSGSAPAWAAVLAVGNTTGANNVIFSASQNAQWATGGTFSATAPEILGPTDAGLFISAGATAATTGRTLTLTAGAGLSGGAGGALTETAGAGQGAGNGGAWAANGGVAGATGAGGAASVTGGAGLAGVGGLASLVGGAGVGVDKAPGGITISSGVGTGNSAAVIAIMAAPSQGSGSANNVPVTVVSINASTDVFAITTPSTATGKSLTISHSGSSSRELSVSNATAETFATFNAMQTSNAQKYNCLLSTTAAQAINTGPGLDFTGRISNSAGPAEASYAGIAGLKENGTVADPHGYLIFCTTGATIEAEAARFTSAGALNLGGLSTIGSRGQIQWNTGLTFSATQAQIAGPADTGLFISAGATAATTGRTLTLTAGTGLSNGAGGTFVSNAGAGQGSGNGGAWSGAGGAAGATGAGGAASVTGGNGVAGAGGLASLNGGNGVGADKNSGGATIFTGQATGTGFSDAVLQTSFMLATGSTGQTTGDRFRIAGKRLVLSNTTGTATAFASLSTTSGSAISGTCFYSVEATDGTEWSCAGGQFDFTCVNKAGTLTAAAPLIQTEVISSSTGATLATTGTPTVVASGANLLLKVTPAFSGTNAAGVTSCKVSWEIVLRGLSTVTPQ